MVAQLTTRSDATSTFHYLYRDGLGSTVALTGQAGGSAQAFAYAPYGRRRAAANWSSLLSPTQAPHIDPPTRRGYTGGEQFDALGAVVLGARVYIPALGRWLSPDPAGIDSPYVYAGDNPESATDPTGEFGVWDAVGMVVGVVITYYTGDPELGGAVGGFVSGFGDSGGNVKDGAIGAAEGAAMGYIGGATGGANATGEQLLERGLAEGLVSGTASALASDNANGSFVGGFLAAFGAAVIGGEIYPHSSSIEVVALRTTAMTVLGGTVSELAGGSFANGARSAAFQQLFNEAEHRITNPSRAKINRELALISEIYHVPLRALEALIGTESSFRQFDSSGQPLVSQNPKSSAIGLGQITKTTATGYGLNYKMLGTDWGYNLASAVRIYSVGYEASLNSKIKNLQIRAARAYDMYHSWTKGLGSSGLTGKPWESLYLNWYDKF